MTRVTSIETYHRVLASGELSKRRMEIYQIVYKYGPLTSAEAFRYLNENRPMRNITQSRARFTELRDMGLLSELGTRKCKVTGHNVILWETTNNMIKKLKKKPAPRCLLCGK